MPVREASHASALASDGTTEAVMYTQSLSERKADWFFVVAFTAFALTSFIVDLPSLLGFEWVEHQLAASYADADPLFVDPPPFLRVAAGVSAVVWGPLYVYLVWGFLRGRNEIRVPALMYAAALTLAMLMIIAEELFSTVPGWRTPRPGKFLALNLPYLLVPMLLAFRMRHPFPFGGGIAAAEPLLRRAAERP
jgi:hypothetical protein